MFCNFPTKKTNNSIRHAGNFDGSLEYNAEVVVKKGSVTSNPRSGRMGTFKFVPSDGFDVLKANVDNFRLSTDFKNNPLIDDVVYFKRCKGAAQRHFVHLDHENFQEHLHYRWQRISKGDVDHWRSQNKTPREAFCFQFFVYVEKHQRIQERPLPERGQIKIRRATPSRRRVAADLISEYERESNVTLGPITRYYSSIQHARLPDGTPYTPGQGNTIRQMQELDEEGARDRQEREEAAEARTSVAQPMRLLINGVWVELKVDIMLMRMGKYSNLTRNLHLKEKMLIMLTTATQIGTAALKKKSDYPTRA